MDEFISGPSSFVQKVFYSPLYMGWWKDLVAQGSGGPTGLSAAKHRFSSFQLPLSRLADNVREMVSLCHKISVIRGESGEWAGKILLHLNGEKVLLLALAADAATTCCDLTRTMDDEAVDIAQVPARLHTFAKSIETLFLEEKVFELPTYTT